MANWEISSGPLSATYTNGAPAGDPVASGCSVATGAAATVHPAASPQTVTVSLARAPLRSPRLIGLT